MGGLQHRRETVCSAIRDQRHGDKRPRVPIVAITASAMPDERRRCLDAGMDDVLIKPFMLDALRQVLNKWAGAI
jgi:CheY-like chemotaxis protein